MGMYVVLLLMAILVDGEAGPKSDQQRMTVALKKSSVYLEQDGKRWFEGKLPVQDGSACVSCHQVPGGAWSLSAANRSLDREPSSNFKTLLGEAAEFATDEEKGRPAIWSQLLISEAILHSKSSDQSSTLLEQFMPLILESQNENGSWPAKGQFPSQRRPVAESDAVVTMWMIQALRLNRSASTELDSSLTRAFEFINQQDGGSTEFVAWRFLTGVGGSAAGGQSIEPLTSMQNDDGSWGWSKGEPGNAYSTGVALYALLVGSGKIEEESKQAIQYLLKTQAGDGTWHVDSGLVSKEGPTENLDYIYEYWSTAWATIALSEALRITDGSRRP